MWWRCHGWLKSNDRSFLLHRSATVCQCLDFNYTCYALQASAESSMTASQYVPLLPQNTKQEASMSCISVKLATSRGLIARTEVSRRFGIQIDRPELRRAFIQRVSKQKAASTWPSRAAHLDAIGPFVQAVTQSTTFHQAHAESTPVSQPINMEIVPKCHVHEPSQEIQARAPRGCFAGSIGFVPSTLQREQHTDIRDTLFVLSQLARFVDHQFR